MVPIINGDVNEATSAADEPVRVSSCYSSALVGSWILRDAICLSRFCCREKQEMKGDNYFLFPACLALTASCFFRAALSAWALCCLDFFCVDFGDLSPIILLLFCVLTGLRHD